MTDILLLTIAIASIGTGYLIGNIRNDRAYTEAHKEFLAQKERVEKRLARSRKNA